MMVASTVFVHKKSMLVRTEVWDTELVHMAVAAAQIEPSRRVAAAAESDQLGAVAGRTERLRRLVYHPFHTFG